MFCKGKTFSNEKQTPKFFVNFYAESCAKLHKKGVVENLPALSNRKNVVCHDMEHTAKIKDKRFSEFGWLVLPTRYMHLIFGGRLACSTPPVIFI